MSTAKESPARIVRLCWLAVFDPDGFVRIEAEDSVTQNAQERSPEPRKIDLVRQGLWNSFIWTVSALLVGSLIGLGAVQFAAPKLVVGLLGGLGALVLLWAILGVRGWEIQSLRGQSLSERVNRWLYRFLSWVGTALLAAAAVMGTI